MVFVQPIIIVSHGSERERREAERVSFVIVIDVYFRIQILLSLEKMVCNQKRRDLLL